MRRRTAMKEAGEKRDPERDLWNAYTYTTMFGRAESKTIIIIITTTDDDNDKTAVVDTAR